MVGPQSLARGFGLLGIETFHAETAEKAREHVAQISARKDIGVILITEELFQPFYEKYFELKISMDRPILLEIPTVEEFDVRGEGIAQFVKKATGVTV